MAQTRSLPRICIALGLPDISTLLDHARCEAEAGEVFLEFRLDFLDEPCKGAACIRGFLEQFPDCIILATCRRHQNHGKFNGSIEEQLAILDQAVDAGAHAIDIEIETAEVAQDRLHHLRGRTQVIVSYHNFEATPPMDTVVNRVMKVQADAYKVVTTARKPSDNVRVLSAAKALPKHRMIVLAMGELGFPTRVLSPVFGGVYTYAAPRFAAGTAAGQVSAHSLRHLYRVEKLGKSARIYGVIADPIRHSISPAVHNRAFQSRRVDAVYLPFLVSPAYLRDFFSMAAKLPISGFSVTIPHKQKIIRYLDVVDPLAKRIGAVNTVWRKAGKWRGANTDAFGVTGPLSRVLKLPKSSVLIVGNGGAARGAACALSDAGAKVSLVGRNADRVRALSKVCGAEALGREQLERRHFDAVVHATPLGMFPHVNECFFNGNIPADVVFDMVYNPVETLLVQHAREQGKTVIPGLDMFIEQAVRQFEIWTGESAPRPVMLKAAMEALDHK
ncbi:Shikimate dehydrogenase / 3-dehydroquinate dehydratase [Candidatus Sulfopaludibacter sp. SbA3]|nr:Shikimate dehydrogenase / 3-dehydroquinate dehydratase [Candidatus Sulfopaludibacter sp. SbA3]